MDSRDVCAGAESLESPPDVQSCDSVMVWSLEEAVQKQVLQIGLSACGATAILNALQALGFDVCSEVVEKCVQTRMRKNDAPLAEYLISRSVAGATHQQLIEGAEKASEGRVIGRFFSFYPERNVDLTAWLASWMKKGAIAVATMNMQIAVPEGEGIPDAWHHQMIFGVDSEGIYMTNPLEIERSSLVKQRLCSESQLLIRKQDIMSRLSGDPDFSLLKETVDHSMWEELDVVEQINRMVSGDVAPDDVSHSSHVVIPAAYRSGVTLFTRRHSDLTKELLLTPELPLLNDQ
ncbi:uncharacterized protein LOC125461362 isoform X1 [Stegostoma tigrinum]|uniref:uncharacterized protein LOC125461362 isoform X1 n=1 Tax=Stegostoma tigrinum TaxID=3053191 RepID=UPI00202B75D0|nr:uncharacterized protein LOC125461362 isoform X1 [Stegostoma tigrinum]XP_059508655.1 uncharacterized protein LOC125461362 isoform X1 [Stegostoma tigrinum]